MGGTYYAQEKIINEGAHTISIKETGNNGVKTTLSSKTFYIARLFPKGNIERPTNGQTIKGIFNVSGWFLDTSGVDKIEVLVDGVVKGTAVYGLSRPDGASAYPQYNKPLIGYGFNLDTSTLTVGKHTVSVREKDKNGATTSLSAKTVYVTR